MQHMDVLIEEMRLDEIPRVLALWQSIPALNLSGVDSAEGIARYLQRNPGLSTVARRKGEIVGALLCGHDGRRGSFYHLGVLPDFRRKGIAQSMVERSLQCLRQINIHTAFLFTSETNVPAQAFWTETGWQYCPWVRYHYREFEKQ